MARSLRSLRQVATLRHGQIFDFKFQSIRLQHKEIFCSLRPIFHFLLFGNPPKIPPKKGTEPLITLYNQMLHLKRNINSLIIPYKILRQALGAPISSSLSKVLPIEVRYESLIKCSRIKYHRCYRVTFNSYHIFVYIFYYPQFAGGCLPYK